MAEAAARAAAAAAASLQDEMNLEDGLPVAHAGQIQASEARQIAREVLHAVLGGPDVGGSWVGSADEGGGSYGEYMPGQSEGGSVIQREGEESEGHDSDVARELDCLDLRYDSKPSSSEPPTLSSLDLQVGGRAYLSTPQALPLIGPAVVVADPYCVAALPSGRSGPACRCLFARRAGEVRASIELAESNSKARDTLPVAVSTLEKSTKSTRGGGEALPALGRTSGTGGDGAVCRLQSPGEPAGGSGKEPAKKALPRLPGMAETTEAPPPPQALPRKGRRRPTSFRRGENSSSKGGINLESHHSLSEKRAAGTRRPQVRSRGRLGQDNVLRGRAIGTGP